MLGHLVYLYNVIFSGYQTEIKERTTVELRLNNTPVSGYLMVAIIHDHVDLVREPIIGRLGNHTPNGTPFTVFSGKNPDSTSYEKFSVEYIGTLNGAVIPLDAEDRVHFKFPVLSSDLESKNFEYFFQRAERAFLYFVVFCR